MDDSTAAIKGFMPIPAKRGRKPLDIDSRDASGKLLPRYVSEKQIGIRRQTGARKLKRLTRRHYEIIARHLAGQSGNQVAVAMRITVGTVSRILNDPLAVEVVRRAHKDREKEVDALVGNAVEAVREVFQDEDSTTQQKMVAVEKAVKLREVLVDGDKEKETAEDVIQKLYAQINITGENIQVNVGDKE